MADDSFDVRLSQLERALDVIAGISANPELQASAFAWLMQGSTPVSPAPPAPSAVRPNPDTAGSSAGGGAEPASKKTNGSKRTTKTGSVAQDKSVQLAPQDATSWVDYATEKSPTNLSEKYTVAIYWLTEVANVPPATINQLVYLFIAAKWNLPADPKNKASVAGSAGYIDSGDMANLKVTALGTALVVNDLPRKKSK